jgi:hypothetical protein
VADDLDRLLPSRGRGKLAYQALKSLATGHDMLKLKGMTLIAEFSEAA